MFYPANSTKGYFPVPGNHDPDSVRTFGLLFAPPTWQLATVYKRSGVKDAEDEHRDIVRPTEYTGLNYVVENPGKSGATEPTWVMVPGEQTYDGTKGLIWTAFLDELMPVGVTVSLATVTATNGVVISAVTVATGSVDFTINAIDPLAAARTTLTFDVLTHATLSNGNIIDRTLRFKVGNT